MLREVNAGEKHTKGTQQEKTSRKQSMAIRTRKSITLQNVCATTATKLGRYTSANPGTSSIPDKNATMQVQKIQRDWSPNYQHIVWRWRTSGNLSRANWYPDSTGDKNFFCKEKNGSSQISTTPFCQIILASGSELPLVGQYVLKNCAQPPITTEVTDCSRLQPLSLPKFDCTMNTGKSQLWTGRKKPQCKVAAQASITPCSSCSDSVWSKF